LGKVEIKSAPKPSMKMPNGMQIGGGK
jgi:hypothetical protein